MVDFDAVLQEIGEFGRYQKFVVVLLCIPACVMNAFNGFSLVFLAYTPDFTCVGYANASATPNRTLVVEECGYRMTADGNQSDLMPLIPCETYNFSTRYMETTLVTEWGLVCDRSILPKLAISLYTALAVVGCSFMSIIQDRHGRKFALLVCITFLLIGNSLALFMPNFLSFAVSYAICQVPSTITYNIGYIMAMEYVGPSKRTLVSTIFSIVYATAIASLAGIAYLTRGWRDMGWAITAPFIVLYSYIWLVMESPRWLLSVGRVDEAKRVIERMMRFEGKKVEWKRLEELLAQTEPVDNPTAPGEGQGKRAGVLDLFRSANLRKKTLIVTFCMIANAVVYYSMPFNIENIGGDFYLTYVLQAIVEIPAVFVVLAILNRVGRIWPLWSAMLLCGISSLLTAIEWNSEVWTILLSCLSKFGICVSYAIAIQLAAELYPTVLRGVGMGFSSVVADTCSMLMPYIVHSAEHYRALPMIILGTLTLISGSTTLFLPETLNQYLPETREEAEVHGVVGRAALFAHWRRLRGWCHSAQPTKENDEDNDIAEATDVDLKAS